MVERFIRYVKVDTQADSSSSTCPSSPGQLELGRMLADEMKAIGLTEITIDDSGIVMATLPDNGCPDAPVVGFVLHMDTAVDLTGRNVKPRVVANYEGEDIILNQAANIVLSPVDFPELANYQGQDIFVTDGNTLLGADNKAGICEVMTAVEYLIKHPEVPHGKVRIAMTPDEEIGRGVGHFNVAAFGADFAYTLDGGELGELIYESFNAANALVHFNGRIVHPGTAKNKMINALTMAAEWQMMLPAGQKPEFTEGYEGFFHPKRISGGVDHVVLDMLIRDHDRTKFEARKAYIHSLADCFNAKYGPNTVSVDMKDIYYNMGEKIEAVFFVVEEAQKAMNAVGVTPKIVPIRGGTDGAQLSYMGLPCPNIFAGGHNYHGKYEYIPVPSMIKATEVAIELIRRWGQFKA
jgi:tripeptide aminopeptidase